MTIGLLIVCLTLTAVMVVQVHVYGSSPPPNPNRPPPSTAQLISLFTCVGFGWNFVRTQGTLSWLLLVLALAPSAGLLPELPDVYLPLFKDAFAVVRGVELATKLLLLSSGFHVTMMAHLILSVPVVGCFVQEGNLTDLENISAHLVVAAALGALRQAYFDLRDGRRLGVSGLEMLFICARAAAVGPERLWPNRLETLQWLYAVAQLSLALPQFMGVFDRVGQEHLFVPGDELTQKAMPIVLLTATVLKSGHFQMITTIICYSAADLYRAVGGLVQQLALQGDPEAEKEGMKTYHLEKLRYPPWRRKLWWFSVIMAKVHISLFGVAGYNFGGIKRVMFFVHCAWNFMDGFDDGPEKAAEAKAAEAAKKAAEAAKTGEQATNVEDKPPPARASAAADDSPAAPVPDAAEKPEAAASPSSRKKVPSGKKARAKARVDAAARQELLLKTAGLRNEVK